MEVPLLTGILRSDGNDEGEGGKILGLSGDLVGGTHNPCPVVRET